MTTAYFSRAFYFELACFENRVSAPHEQRRTETGIRPSILVILRYEKFYHIPRNALLFSDRREEALRKNRTPDPVLMFMLHTRPHPC
jgi:hypothetical protein